MAASKAQQAITAERRRAALAMSVAGHTLTEIADALGYAGRAAVSKDITRALNRRKDALAEQVDLARTRALERLDAMEQEVWRVLRRPHPLVQGGRVVRIEARDANGQLILDADSEPVMVPLYDDGPVLDAIDRLVKIGVRRDRLEGTDTGAPAPIQNNNLFVLPGTRDADQQLILATLAQMVAKSTAIEGELAQAGTDLVALTGHAAADDRPAPPPVVATNGNGHKPTKTTKGSP